MADPWTNFPVSTVATAPSPAASGTSLVVAAGEGARFISGRPAIIKPASTLATPANAEVVLITNISTDTLTITRAQEGSSARTVLVGDQIAQPVTAAWLNRFTPYVLHRLMVENTGIGTTFNVNSTSYVVPYNSFRTSFDYDAFPFTHFRLVLIGNSNAVAQTITCQIVEANSPTDPISAAGDDLVVTNTPGTFDSGWIALSDPLSGLQDLGFAMKGSNTTVDLVAYMADLHFKIE